MECICAREPTKDELREQALVKASQEALETLMFSEVFVSSRQKIKEPEGVDMYRDTIQKLEKALADYKA